MYFSRVLLEVTTICNSACIYCPHPTQKRKKASMEFELFKKIIDDLFANHVTDIIHLNIMGEAILHKDFFKMVDYIKANQKYPVRLITLTNGLLLKNESIQEAILDSPLNILGISVRAKNEHEYKLKLNRKFQDYNDYDAYIASINSLIRKVHERDTDLLISLNYFHTVYSCYTIIPGQPFLTTKSQVYELTKSWYASVKDYKETIPLKKIKIPFSSKIGCTSGNTIKISPKLQLRLNKAMLWHNKLLPDEYFIKETSHGMCEQPLDELIITATGDVAGCGADFDCDINLGNLRNSSINEVITTQYYMDFKNNLKRCILTMPICKICSGTITKKDTGEELIFRPPLFLKYYCLFIDNPILCIKRIWKTMRKKRMMRF